LHWLHVCAAAVSKRRRAATAAEAAAKADPHGILMAAVLCGL